MPSARVKVLKVRNNAISKGKGFEGSKNSQNQF